MVKPTPTLIAAYLLVTSAQGHQQHFNNDHTITTITNNQTTLLDTILARGYLKVGTTGDYKPFTYLVGNKTSTLPPHPSTNSTISTPYIGADITTAHSLSASLSLPHPPVFIPTTWSSLAADLAAEKFDIGMSGISITLPRASRFFFSSPVQRVGKAACIRCSDSSRFTSLSAIDVAGVVVAVNPGGTNEAFDRANLRSATIKVVEDNNAVYAAVMAGTADVMISDVVEVELQVRLHPGVLCMVNKGVEDTFTFEELGYMVRRDVVWKNYLDWWVRALVGSGEWERTLEMWMGYQWPSV